MTYYQPTSLNQHIGIFSIHKIEELYLYMTGRPDRAYNTLANINRKNVNEVKNKEKKPAKPPVIEPTPPIKPQPPTKSTWIKGKGKDKGKKA